MIDRQPDSPIDELLARAMAGDREAMAVFILHYGELIRRRLRGKLSPAARSVFDSEDVLAEVLAAADRLLASDDFSAPKHVEQLWKFIWTVSERTVWRQNELAARHWPGPAAGEGTSDAATTIEFTDDLEQAMRAVRGDDDRDMLLLWLRGLTPTAIAGAMGRSPQAIWKRWERLRRRMGSQESEVRGQESEVRGQRSGVRGQRSEVRGQGSEVRSQNQKSEGRSAAADSGIPQRSCSHGRATLGPPTSDP